MGIKIQGLYKGSVRAHCGDRTGVSQAGPRCTDLQGNQPIVSDPRDMEI